MANPTAGDKIFRFEVQEPETTISTTSGEPTPRYVTRFRRWGSIDTLGMGTGRTRFVSAQAVPDAEYFIVIWSADVDHTWRLKLGDEIYGILRVEHTALESQCWCKRDRQAESTEGLEETP